MTWSSKLCKDAWQTKHSKRWDGSFQNKLGLHVCVRQTRHWIAALHRSLLASTSWGRALSFNLRSSIFLSSSARCSKTKVTLQLETWSIRGILGTRLKGGKKLQRDQSRSQNHTGYFEIRDVHQAIQNYFIHVYSLIGFSIVRQEGHDAIHRYLKLEWIRAGSCNLKWK